MHPSVPAVLQLATAICVACVLVISASVLVQVSVVTGLDCKMSHYSILVHQIIGAVQMAPAPSDYRHLALKSIAVKHASTNVTISIMCKSLGKNVQ